MTKEKTDKMSLDRPTPVTSETPSKTPSETPSGTPAASPDLGARVVQLEMLLTHFEHLLDELNGVIVGQEKRIAALEGRLEGLRTELAGVRGALTEERKPEDEKPPHY